jgi:hypothetical protein
MPWHSLIMGTRGLVTLALLLALTACSGDGSTDQAGSDTTTAADCASRIPDSVFKTLRWSPPKAAEATVRGCHREAAQGYVEVRERTGYDRLCKTLDRSGGVAPGVPADWLGTDVVACAVEPVGDVGQTKVVVQGEGDEVTQVTIAVLTSTSQAQVRAAVAELVGTG